MIRPATPLDLDALCDMGALFHAEQPWAATCGAYDRASFRETVEGLGKGGVLLVAEADGAPVGMIAASLSRLYFNKAVCVAQEVFWYVLPSHRRGVGGSLLAAMEAACKRAGAGLLFVAGVDAMRGVAVDRVLRMAGYAGAETTRWKVLA